MNARILPPTPENIELAVERLKKGELVAIPTETVYGLAGDVFNSSAVSKIFQAKERPTFDPLIAHVAWPSSLGDLSSAGLVDLQRLNATQSAQIEKLIATFWPGPLTLVLPKLPGVPDLATSGLDSVAIRCPNHSVTQEILRRVQTPLAAPSANRFGRISPTSAEDVLAELSDRISIIVDGGRCSIGLESTILHCSENGWTLLRPGKISLEEIEAVIGVKVARNLTSSAEGKSAAAPGMLASHYAPRTRLVLFPFSDFEALEALRHAHTDASALLLFSENGRNLDAVNLSAFSEVRFLTTAWALGEAAQNLFATLRALDEKMNPGTDLIFCEEIPSESQATGLGYAIMDRLKRASHS